MSQEDIYEVERLEKEQLERYAWKQQNPEPPCANCKDCYSERDTYPCNDCNVLDSSKSVSHWKHYKGIEE